MEPGATTPPEVVLPVLAPVEGVTVPAPPLVAPVEGVVLAGGLVAGVVVPVVVPVVAGVVVEGVEVVLADELLVVTIDVDAVEEVAPVAPLAPLEPVELALSSLL